MNKLLSLSAAFSLFIPVTFAADTIPAAATPATPAPAATTPAATLAAPAPAAPAAPVAEVPTPVETSDLAPEAAAPKLVETTPATTIPDPVTDSASTFHEDAPPYTPEQPNRPRYKRSSPVRHLIITSNYETPAFLAKIARENADCTVIIVPAALDFPERGTILTVIPPNTNDAFALRAEDLSRFLAFIRPVNVIFLGNQDVLPSFYRPAVPRESKIINVVDSAWQVNAIKLDNVLNTSQKIFRSYRRYLRAQKQMEKKPSVSSDL